MEGAAHGRRRSVGWGRCCLPWNLPPARFEQKPQIPEGEHRCVQVRQEERLVEIKGTKDMLDPLARTNPNESHEADQEDAEGPAPMAG